MTAAQENSFANPFPDFSKNAKEVSFLENPKSGFENPNPDFPVDCTLKFYRVRFSALHQAPNWDQSAVLSGSSPITFDLISQEYKTPYGIALGVSRSLATSTPSKRGRVKKLTRMKYWVQ